MKEYMKQTVPIWVMLVVLGVTGTLMTRQMNAIERQMDRFSSGMEQVLKTLALQDKEIAILQYDKENTKSFQEQALKNQRELIILMDKHYARGNSQ